MPGGKKTVPMEDSDVQEGDPVQVLREPPPPSVQLQIQTRLSFPNLKTTPISELGEDDKNEWDLNFIKNFSSTTVGQSGHSTSIPRDKK